MFVQVLFFRIILGVDMSHLNRQERHVFWMAISEVMENMTDLCIDMFDLSSNILDLGMSMLLFCNDMSNLAREICVFLADFIGTNPEVSQLRVVMSQLGLDISYFGVDMSHVAETMSQLAVHMSQLSTVTSQLSISMQ